MSMKGKPHSEETKRKISESLKGIPCTPERREKISESLRGRPCTTERREKLLITMRTEDFKKRISEALKGRRLSEETKRKMSEAKKGRQVSEETRRKTSESEKNKIVSEQTRRKMSKYHKTDEYIAGFVARIRAANTGKKWSEETKRKLSEAKRAKNRHCTEDTKKKIGDANRGEKCGTWLGGISFLPYCHKFNRQLKEVIRSRDNRTCQLCGETENGRKLHVHHVHYDKKNCEPDLVSLCHRCHSKVNHNRDYYEELFMKKLEERGLMI